MSKSKRRSDRQCPNGHRMDPNWVNCPYCEAEDRGKKPSTPPPKMSAEPRDRTRVNAFVESPRRKTKPLDSAPAAREPAANTGENRRIMGILISYTWRPEGELFAVREGQNYIGRNQVSSVVPHRDCDIMVTQDIRMSGVHALILCRHGIYEIVDLKSANGTFVNGKMLKTTDSTELGETAEIRTGDTLWSFFKIQPGKADVAPPATKTSIREATPEKEESTVKNPSFIG